jgi:hypothetical protein
MMLRPPSSPGTSPVFRALITRGGESPDRGILPYDRDGLWTGLIGATLEFCSLPIQSYPNLGGAAAAGASAPGSVPGFPYIYQGTPNL